MINRQVIDAIYKLYPEAVATSNEIAYDTNGNEIQIDLDAVTAQAQAQADAQAVLDAKQTALNKLMALGLTEEEALALGK
jgi:hypothetical protein